MNHRTILCNYYKCFKILQKKNAKQLELESNYQNEKLNDTKNLTCVYLFVQWTSIDR